MKLYIPFFVGAALILGLTFQSCENSIADGRSDRDNRMESTNTNTDHNRELAQYRDQTEARIQENNRRIRSLKNGNSMQRSEMNQDREKELTRIEDRNRTLQDELNKFESDSEEAWQDFKNDFNEQMEEIEGEIESMTADD